MENVFSVTQFNKLIKEVFNELGTFLVQGEITELNITKRQGVAITLSDGKSNIKIGGYAPTIRGINEIEKGMKVLVEGICDVYVPYGSFSLSIHKIEPTGEGDLKIAYEKLKHRLANEGLFNLEFKKELPQYINKIALLTAEDSAAYSDFIKILREHNAGLNIDFYPVNVQGTNSVDSINKAFSLIGNSLYDAVVLTRGGGSLEDLKSFNDESIVRKIFHNKIPTIVGVGHEKDESLCDFVADVRASTPSQCAYYIVERNERFLEDLGGKILAIKNRIEEAREEILQITSTTIQDIKRSLDRQLQVLIDRVESNNRILNSFNIHNILKRGFAIIEKDDKIILSTKQLKSKDDLKITMTDKSFNAKVGHINT